MENLRFMRLSALILLTCSLGVTVTMVGLVVTNILSGPEFKELFLAVVPAMAGYIPSALAFAFGDVKVKKVEVWLPIAFVVFGVYIAYFCLIELSLLSYSAAGWMDLGTTKSVLSSLQTVFALVVGSVFVKKLAARPR